MPYIPADFSWANFDFESGTASVEASPLDVEITDLVSLSTKGKGLDDDEPALESGKEVLPVSCKKLVRIADIKKSMRAELYTPPVILPKVNRKPRRASNSSSKTSSSSRSTLLDPINEEGAFEDGCYPKAPIDIVVTDYSIDDEENRNWLIELDILTLAPPFPPPSHPELGRIPVAKAVLEAPMLQCRETSRHSYSLEVPKKSYGRSVRYSTKKCQVCMDEEKVWWADLREAAEERKSRPALVTKRSVKPRARSSRVKNFVQRSLKPLVNESLFKPFDSKA